MRILLVEESTLTAVGTIHDNDQVPILGFASANVEGTEGRSADFVVNILDPVTKQTTTSGKKYFN